MSGPQMRVQLGDEIRGPAAPSQAHRESPKSRARLRAAASPAYRPACVRIAAASSAARSIPLRPTNTFTLIRLGSGHARHIERHNLLHGNLRRIAFFRQRRAPNQHGLIFHQRCRQPLVLRREYHGVDAAAAVLNHQRCPRFAFAVAASSERR